MEQNEKMQILVDSPSAMLGYVYRDQSHEVYWFDGSTENIASFLMKFPDADRMILTDQMDKYMFVRNLYETRRMLYTLYNAIGDNDQTWRNGKPVLSSKGNQLVHIRLTIPDGTTSQVFWPWRATEITNLFHSCPPGTYSMESWDVYKNGVFQRTEYKIHVS